MAAAETNPPTIAKLRQRVRSAAGTPGRAEAFAELIERSPRDLNRTLISLAADADCDPAIRVKAVAALGRRPTPATVDAVRGLTADDQVVVARRAIETLGKVGQPEDLGVLRAVTARDVTTERVLRTAKLFISYRHGLGEYRFDAPRRTLAAGAETSVPIRTGAPTKTMLNSLELLAPHAPGIEVAEAPVRRLVCGGNEFALMLDRHLAGTDDVVSKQALPAVLLLQNIETGEFEPAYYLMTDPTGAGTFRITGVRSSGRVGLHGSATVSGSVVRFEVNASEEPLDHPLTVAGTFDGETGRLRFETAITETEFSERQQARRRQPRLVERPDR